jgi:hypothetical protein
MNYLSTVLSKLRDDYGVTDAEQREGGKHPCVRFTHRGRRFRLTLGHDGRKGSVDMKLQDIRRLLGPPPSPAPSDKPRRRLEDMMPEQAQIGAAGHQVQFFAPATTGEVTRASPEHLAARVAAYKNGNRLRLHVNVPETMVSGWAVGVGARAVGEDAWELYPDSSTHRSWSRGDTRGTVKVDLYDATVMETEPFGSSGAEVVSVDGHLLITCRVKDRVALGQRPEKRRPSANSSETVKSATITERDLEAWGSVGGTGTYGATGASYRERMVAVLREIAALEAETDRRLVRVKDSTPRRWEWHAAPVRLEE